MTNYNLSVIDKDGRTLNTKGVSPDDVSAVKLRMLAQAKADGFQKPIGFYKKPVA